MKDKAPDLPFCPNCNKTVDNLVQHSKVCKKRPKLQKIPKEAKEVSQPEDRRKTERNTKVGSRQGEREVVVRQERNEQIVQMAPRYQTRRNTVGSLEGREERQQGRPMLAPCRYCNRLVQASRMPQHQQHDCQRNRRRLRNQQPQHHHLNPQNPSSLLPQPPPPARRRRNNSNQPINFGEILSLELFLIDGLLFLYTYLDIIDQQRLSQEQIDGLRQQQYSGNEAKSCVICIQDFGEKEKVVQLNCRHLFHPGCIRPWLQVSTKCPMCKADQRAGRGNQ